MLRCGHSGRYSILALSVAKIWNILTTIRDIHHHGRCQTCLYDRGKIGQKGNICLFCSYVFSVHTGQADRGINAPLHTFCKWEKDFTYLCLFFSWRKCSKHLRAQSYAEEMRESVPSHVGAKCKADNEQPITEHLWEERNLKLFCNWMYVLCSAFCAHMGRHPDRGEGGKRSTNEMRKQ